MKFLQKYEYQLRQLAEQSRLENNSNVLYEAIQKQISEKTDWKERCRLAKSLRKKSLKHLDTMLASFEKKAIKNKSVVYWAQDAKEANEKILMLVKRAEALSLHLSPSPELTEIDIERSLIREKYQIQPTTPAHFISRKAKERPSHPEHLLLDKSQKGILDFLSKKMELDLNPNSKEAAQDALFQMRKKVNKYPAFPSVSLFSPDFLLADSGGILWFDNEGNSSWSLSSTSINIVVVGIERILETFDEKLLECLSVFNLYRQGDMNPDFVNVLYGPAHKDEKDGPSQLYIILLDNGRSQLLGNPILKDALIDLDGWAQWFTRSWASKLKKSEFPHYQVNHFEKNHSASKAGALFLETPTDAPHFNPFGLDYTAMLLEMRRIIVEKNQTKGDQELMNQWGKMMKNRLEITKYRSGMKKMLFRRKLKQAIPESENLPPIAPQTFTEWWATRKK